MFIVVLLIIAKNLKQSKCSSTGELINSGTSVKWNITTWQYKGINYWYN